MENQIKNQQLRYALRLYALLSMFSPHATYESTRIYSAMEALGLRKEILRKMLLSLERHRILDAKVVAYRSPRLRPDSPLHNLVKTQKVYRLSQDGVKMIESIQNAYRELNRKEEDTEDLGL